MSFPTIYDMPIIIGVSYTIGKLLNSAFQYTGKLWEIRGTRTCIRVHVMGALGFCFYIPVPACPIAYNHDNAGQLEYMQEKKFRAKMGWTVPTIYLLSLPFGSGRLHHFTHHHVCIFVSWSFKLKKKSTRFLQIFPCTSINDLTLYRRLKPYQGFTLISPCCWQLI